MLLFEWASRIETVGYKLAEGKGLREGWDSKELWKSVDKQKRQCLCFAHPNVIVCGARKARHPHVRM